MHKYCKAYRLQDLRQFSGWIEALGGEGEPLTDDTICYLWDDFTVVRSPVQEQGVIFEGVTPEWQAFCATTLQFEIPEDLRCAYQQGEHAPS
jgi:hypothetical protein